MTSSNPSPDRSFDDLSSLPWDELLHLLRPAKAQHASENQGASAVPFGYCQVKVGHKTRLAIDPVAGPLVVEAFRRAGEG